MLAVPRTHDVLGCAKAYFGCAKAYFERQHANQSAEVRFAYPWSNDFKNFLNHDPKIRLLNVSKYVEKNAITGCELGSHEFSWMKRCQKYC